MNIIRITLALAVFCLSATGCGGGGDNDKNGPPATGGIARTGISSGPISTFGSIVVNGVHFDTNAASFNVNDAPGTQGDLSVGQIVTVRGTINANGTSGSANEVWFDDSVTGPVESIDSALGQLIVLGQVVLVRAETSFDDGFSPASLDGVSVGQNVEVSGQFDASNNIVATRIEPKPVGTQFEIHGIVSSLDTSSMRFNINALIIDFSSAMLDDFVGGQISDGDFVEAKGATLGAAGELLATKVELESLLPGADDGDHVEIEGFITRFDSAQDFDVSGMPVTTTAGTVFVGGSAADLGLNVKVEAEGELDGNGILNAIKIDIRRAKAIRVTAHVDSIDPATESLVILGISVAVDNLTRFEDKSDAKAEPLSLTDINAGDYLEIRGSEFPGGSESIIAARLEREDPDDEAILQGFVESVGDPAFVILGVTIETTSSTVFEDANENVLSAAEFFSQLGTGVLVKAKGTEVSDSAILATEVEFESE